MIITKTRDVKLPSKGTEYSAGLDFYIPNDYCNASAFTLWPGKSVKIPSGIKMVIPTGYVGVFMNKSSIGSKGIMVGACVIDSDYRGEVHIDLHNVGTEIELFQPGQKIVQMLILPIHMVPYISEVSEEVFEKYNNTQRGTGGFGSTGST